MAAVGGLRAGQRQPGKCHLCFGRHTAILVDAGLSGIEIQRRMARKGLAPNSLDAILVSHEHTDHIQGVGVLSRRYRLPIFITDGTRQAAGHAWASCTPPSRLLAGMPLPSTRWPYTPSPSPMTPKTRPASPTIQRGQSRYSHRPGNRHRRGQDALHGLWPPDSRSQP